MKVETIIQKWGNGLAPSVSGVMRDIPHFEIGTKVDVEVKATGLVICCPISTSIRGGITEVEIFNLEQPCVIAASLIQTLSWKERKIKFIKKAEPFILKEVLSKLLPLIGAESLFE